MGITLGGSEDASLLRLEGVMDISVAAQLKAALVDALRAGKDVHVSAEGMKELDVTAFQLLWAAEREAKRSGVEFKLTGELPEHIQSFLTSDGLMGLFAPEK